MDSVAVRVALVVSAAALVAGHVGMLGVRRPVRASRTVRAVVAAMIDAHPYEEPAWDLVQLVTELPAS